MKRILLVFVSSFLLIALVACAQGKETKSELDYDQTKKMIVDIHDYYRSRVTPSASNMLKMVLCKFI